MQMNHHPGAMMSPGLPGPHGIPRPDSQLLKGQPGMANMDAIARYTISNTFATDFVAELYETDRLILLQVGHLGELSSRLRGHCQTFRAVSLAEFGVRSRIRRVRRFKRFLYHSEKFGMRIESIRQRAK